MASAAAERDIFLIYISTDYVFPGKPGEAPYETDAVPSPPNLYGQTKLDGEKATLEEYKKASKVGLAAVLRVPVLYGTAETPSESAVNTLMDSVWKAQTQGQKIKMDHWSIRYPTNTEDVSRVCYGRFAAQYMGIIPWARIQLIDGKQTLRKSISPPATVHRCRRSSSSPARRR